MSCSAFITIKYLQLRLSPFYFFMSFYIIIKERKTCKGNINRGYIPHGTIIRIGITCN